MANNRIQVKRTTVSGRTPNTTNAGNSQYIATGEFALNLTDGILYSSNGSALIEIGANNSILNVGNSTVNAVVNSTSVKISNSTSNTTLSIPNTSAWSATNYFLHANGSWVQVTGGGGGGASNIQVQNTSVSTPNNGVLYWNSDLGKLLIYYTDGTSNQFVEATLSGYPGPQGLAATINVNSTTTGAPGTSASVTNIGDSSNVSLNFVIPRGSTIAVNSSVTVGTPGSNPSISVTSNSTFDNVISFTLSTGAAGPMGPKSITIPNPVAGDTFTILWTNSALTVAEVKTLVRGTSPTVNATISWGADRSTASNTIITNYTTSNVTNGNTATSFTNSTPIANSYIWVTINSTTGTVNEYHATLRFTT